MKRCLNNELIGFTILVTLAGAAGGGMSGLGILFGGGIALFACSTVFGFWFGLIYGVEFITHLINKRKGG